MDYTEMENINVKIFWWWLCISIIVITTSYNNKFKLSLILPRLIPKSKVLYMQTVTQIKMYTNEKLVVIEC